MAPQSVSGEVFQPVDDSGPHATATTLALRKPIKEKRMNDLPITVAQLYEALRDHFRRSYSCKIEALYHLIVLPDGKAEHHRGARRTLVGGA